MNFCHKKRTAFTVIELLVAVTLAVAVIGVLGSVGNTTYKSYRLVSKKLEVERMRRLIRQKIDCHNTVDAAQRYCLNGKNAVLYDKKNRKIFSTAGTEMVFGPFRLRGTFVGDSGTIDLQFKDTRDTASVYQPLFSDSAPLTCTTPFSYNALTPFHLREDINFFTSVHIANAAHHTPETMQALCNALCRPTVAHFHDHDIYGYWNRPGYEHDSSAAMTSYNALTNTWWTTPATSTYNHWIAQLTCTF